VLASSGYQQIVFARHDKRIQRLPEEVLVKMREYELQSAQLAS
jgi:enediyne core biosynthesis thioesterase